MCSDIDADNIDTFALTSNELRRLRAEGIVDIVQEHYSADAIMETWRYNPLALSEGEIVDPLSLYAQFWDHDDARVSLAADQLLEG